MNKEIIGFYGIDNFDIVLYLANLLKGLGKTVLMIDNSESGSLACSVPVLSELDSKNEVIEYQGIGFTTLEYDDYIAAGYDYILVHYGFIKNETFKFCTRLVYSVNQLKHNVEKMNNLTNVGEIPKQVLFCDYVSCKIDQKYILDKLKLETTEDNLFVFDLDLYDIKNRILSQYNSTVNFKKITPAVKDYLINTVKILCPEISEKEIKKIYNKVRRSK